MAYNAFTATYDVKKLFFDRENVIRRIGAARAGALRRQGSYIRTRARTDVLKRRKSVSKSPNPPHTHSPTLSSLKNILYFYDSRTETVVIGPVKLNQVNQTTTGRMTVPQLLERGGTAKIHEVQYRPGGRWFRRDLRRRAKRELKYRVRTARYKPRPFMLVALEREIAAGTIADSWRNVVRA